MWPFRRSLKKASVAEIMGELLRRPHRDVVVAIFAAVRAGDLQKLSDGHLANLRASLAGEEANRRAWKLIDEYLEDPEEAGEAGSEIKRNAALIREDERASEWCERQGLAYGSHSRSVPLDEVCDTINAGAAPGRLKPPLAPCDPHKGEVPLMSPGEFTRLKNISWEESQRRVPVGPAPFRPATETRDAGFEYNFGVNESPPPRQASLGQIVRDAVDRHED